MHIKNPLILDKIQASMNLLYDLIEEIDNYQDKSLFFQDPRVIEGWLLLAGDIKEIEIEDAPESDEKWELRSEPFAATLLARRDLFSNYKKLYHLYYDPLYNLWMNYSGMDWDCVSADAKEALKANQYLQGQKDVEDLNEYIEQLNSRSNDARYALYKTLTGIFDILQAIMNKAGQVVIDLKPSDEDFTKAINDDLRGMTHSYGKSLFGDMKEDLNRHYKTYRTAPYTPELWGELLAADEEALSLAKRRQLADCDTTKQEHWGEDMKKQMDENSELMQLIYSSCRTDELFDLRMVYDIQRFISLLNSDNLSIFYDIIVRRNLIQCEMFPELKSQHEEWLNRSNEQPEEHEESGLNESRQSKLDEIIVIMQKGNWKLPATAENIKQLLNTIFGREMSLLEDGDEQQCEKMWDLVERGSGNRMEVVPANLSGFFLEENLLNGSPKTISDDLFGKSNNQTNNINKGKGTPGNCSIAFIAVIPFMRKYIDKIIRQA
jgi:hypothetical protein